MATSEHSDSASGMQSCGGMIYREACLSAFLHVGVCSSLGPNLLAGQAS